MREQIRLKNNARVVSENPKTTIEKPVSSEATLGLSPLQQKRELEKQLNKVEKSIIELEATLDTLSEKMNTPELQQDFSTLQALSEEASLKHKMLNDLNAQWEELTNALGQFDS
jgi:predicted  nucleic acid-binding Zn-ribbon protein